MARNRAARARLIDTLGSISLLAVATHAVLSVFLAATQPPLDQGDPRQWWFRDIGKHLRGLPAFLRDALHGAGPLATGAGFLAAYCVPLLVSTACGVGLILVLQRRRSELRDEDARRVLRWAIAFTLVAAPAFNVLTQDIWLSVAWGRMINHGMNPFAHAYPAALAADLPLEYDPMPMTYGPWWAVVCSFAAAVSGGSALGTWLVLKISLGCAWIACLYSVSAIAKAFGPSGRTLAVAVTGWLPLGMHCGVAEGHNDVMMVAAALLWARSMQKASSVGPLMLAVSILSKYVTAPLALVDVVFHWRARSLTVTRYLRRVLPALLVLAAGLAIVAIGWHGFDQTSAMRDWKFLDPGDVLRLIGRYTGLPIGAVAVPIVAAVFGATMVLELIRLANDPTSEHARRAQLAMMAVILFAVTGHAWPWYFVWCLPFAALAPGFWLSRFVICAATIAPFTTVHWWHLGAEGALRSEWPSFVMYGVALAIAARPLARAQLSGRYGSVTGTGST